MTIVNHDTPEVVVLGNSFMSPKYASPGLESGLASLGGKRAIKISAWPGASLTKWADYLTSPDSDTTRFCPAMTTQSPTLILQPASWEAIEDPLGMQEAFTRIKAWAGNGVSVHIVHTWPYDGDDSYYGADRESEREIRLPMNPKGMYAQSKVALESLNADGIIPVAHATLLAKQKCPELALYLEDNSHPTHALAYLQAMVFHAYLYNEYPPKIYATQPPESVNRPLAVPEDKVPQLQEAAWEAVEEARRSKGR